MAWNKTLYFATTSQVKYNQYACIFADWGVEVRRATVIAGALTEPQYEIENVAAETMLVSHPLRQVARFVERNKQLPYMIEDTMLVIDAFSETAGMSSGLPGADTKNWWRNLGTEGVLRLLTNESNREAMFICQIGVYIGGGKYCFGRGELRGDITDTARSSDQAKVDVPRSNPFYFHSIFQPQELTKTIAELNGAEFSAIDYRRQCAKQILDQLCGTSDSPDSQLDLPFQ